ncbi:MAG: extracellular solute-binding protein [Rhodobacteraceae bacterium]|nr:extracellular solute-binding protein [Paracoccaceae bacterium]
MFSARISKIILISCLGFFGFVSASSSSEVTISHYFSDEFGKENMGKVFSRFEAATGNTMKESPVGHEDFKTDILVRGASDSLPDVFSYWAGARVQFVVDSGDLSPIDDMWARDGLDGIVAKAVADSATLYNGERYLIPMQYHYAGMFYNKQVMADAGITEMPTDWEGFMELCETLKGMGIAPIALGSKFRWPAQFWFDYLILNTAGPEVRAGVMDGSIAYDSDEVMAAVGIWMDMVNNGYFAANSNADTWTDASDKVANGEAAMTLMGTWITGYWNGNGLAPGEDYDFFPFPTINSEAPVSVVGPIDGLVISANVQNKEGAEAFLSFFVSDVDNQIEWTKAVGAVSANVNVDPSVYNELIQRVISTVDGASNFAFNYDLATPPPVAEVGLSMFQELMESPDDYGAILSRAQDSAQSAFAQ